MVVQTVGVYRGTICRLGKDDWVLHNPQYIMILCTCIRYVSKKTRTVQRQSVLQAHGFGPHWARKWHDWHAWTSSDGYIYSDKYHTEDMLTKDHSNWLDGILRWYQNLVWYLTGLGFIEVCMLWSHVFCTVSRVIFTSNVIQCIRSTWPLTAMDFASCQRALKVPKRAGWTAWFLLTYQFSPFVNVGSYFQTWKMIGCWPSLELRFSPLKIGRIPKRKGSSPKHQFSGTMLGLVRVVFPQQQYFNSTPGW